jgi:hypothetical protein
MQFITDIDISVVGQSKRLQSFLDACERVGNFLPYLLDPAAYRALPSIKAAPLLKAALALEKGQDLDKIPYLEEKGISDPDAALRELYALVPSLSGYREQLKDMPEEHLAFCAEDHCNKLFGVCVLALWGDDASSVKATMSVELLQPTRDFVTGNAKATSGSSQDRLTSLFMRISTRYPELVFFQDQRGEATPEIVYINQGSLFRDQPSKSGILELPSPIELLNRFGLSQPPKPR